MTMLDPSQQTPQTSPSGPLRAAPVGSEEHAQHTDSTPSANGHSNSEATQPLTLPFGHPSAGPASAATDGTTGTTSADRAETATPATDGSASPMLGIPLPVPTPPTPFAAPNGQTPHTNGFARPNTNDNANANGVSPSATATSTDANAGLTAATAPTALVNSPGTPSPTAPLGPTASGTHLVTSPASPTPLSPAVNETTALDARTQAPPTPTGPVQNPMGTRGEAHNTAVQATAVPVASPTAPAAPTTPANPDVPPEAPAVDLDQGDADQQPKAIPTEVTGGFGDGLVEVAWDGETEGDVEDADLTEDDAIEMLGLVDDRPAKPSKRVTFIALITALAIIAGLAFAVINVPDPTSDAPLSRPVPDVLGKPVTEAETALGDTFKVSVVRTYHQRGAKDTVVSQDPPPGGRTHRDGGVTLTVSSGPAPVRSPDGLSGADPFELRLRLAQADIPVKWDKQASSTIPIGFVAAVSPEEGEPIDGDLTVFISTGPKEIKVPALTGMAWPRAEALLIRKGLKPTKVLVPSTEDEQGLVLETGPSSGTVRRVGSGITVLVGKGFADNEQLSKGARLPSIYYAGGILKPRTTTTQPAPVETTPPATQRPVDTTPVETSPPSTTPKDTQPTVQQPPSSTPRTTAPPEPTTTLTPSTPPSTTPTTPPSTAPPNALPAVVGQTETAARATLERLGYRVNIQRVSTVDPTLDGMVGSQIPSAGSAAQPGTSVWITVYSFDL